MKKLFSIILLLWPVLCFSQSSGFGLKADLTFRDHSSINMRIRPAIIFQSKKKNIHELEIIKAEFPKTDRSYIDSQGNRVITETQIAAILNFRYQYSWTIIKEEKYMIYLGSSLNVFLFRYKVTTPKYDLTRIIRDMNLCHP